MLIKTPLKPGDVVSIKVITGEEIVTKLVSDTNGNLTVSKPFVLALSQEGVGFMPFMLGVDEVSEITLPATAILAHANARKELKDAYIQQTTGIVTAAPGQL